jgi:multidrug resistance efflux pump
MTNYPAVLAANYPNDDWTLNGDDYDGLTWLSDTPKPSQQELDDAWPAVQQARADVAAARVAAKQSAVSKLEALGLSVDEIREAFGLEVSS